MACLSFPKAPIVTWKNPQSGLQIQWYARGCLSAFPQRLCWDGSSHRRGPGPSVMGNVLLTHAVRASKKVWPWPAVPTLCRSLQFFGKKQTFLFSHRKREKGQLTSCSELGYSARSHPALRRAACSFCGERCPNCSPGSWPPPHTAAHRALTFIAVCGVLTTVGTPIFPHRCCLWNLCYPSKGGKLFLPSWAYCWIFIFSKWKTRSTFRLHTFQISFIIVVLIQVR